MNPIMIFFIALAGTTLLVLLITMISSRGQNKRMLIPTLFVLALMGYLIFQGLTLA
jgi:hypothetical protein